MLDFLFKKRRSAATTSSTSADQPATPEASAARTQARQQAREQAMQQAAALQDEAAALAFIVQCEFADARLHAAQWLQSSAALSEALHAVRNSDRRVAKLLQTRIDDLQRGQRAREQMQAVLEQATALQRDPGLTPDRAADADRAWRAAVASAGAGAAIDAAFSAQFDALRHALSERLTQQTQLQRSLIDTRAHLQTILNALGQPAELAANDTEGSAGADAGNIPATLDVLRQKIAEGRSAEEAASLPKQLLPECERLLDACLAAHTCMTAEALARQQREQVAPPVSVAPKAVDPTDEAVPSENRAQTDSLQSDASQSDALPPKPAKQPPKPKPVAGPEQLLQWQSLLGQLEDALEQGALQAASEAERGLRAFDVKLLKPSVPETSRLNAAYAALHHLQGWARWGGNISREELLQTALALPGQDLPIPELVQKIGGLRARWKLLNVSAGPSPQALWEQFDAACTAAYAPAAAQFEQQDKERQQNRLLAEALIAEAEQFVQQQNAVEATEKTAEKTAEEPDWKRLAQFDARMRQAWQRLGPLGHKEHRLLERAFNNALKIVQKPLRERQKMEVDARHALIAEVAGLAADDRQALDTLRRIQADWQQRAQSVPLARKDEQALWQSFRAACDAIFAQRKQSASQQDAQRQTHLQDKEAVCAQLEQILNPASAEEAFNAAAAQAALQQTKAAWAKTGPAPRTAERAIEQRFRQAVESVERRLQSAREQAASAAIDAEATHIDTRLAMCFALDAALAHGRAAAADIGDWRARWQEAPPLPRISALDQALTRRFEAALAALDGDTASAYAAQLAQQRSRFDEALLEAEVALGLESPPELARQRMQLQVALLQSSLKAGAVVLTGRQHLQRLCELPAAADAAALARIGDVVRRALAS
jgi:exonuclease SbcC